MLQITRPCQHKRDNKEIGTYWGQNGCTPTNHHLGPSSVAVRLALYLVLAPIIPLTLGAAIPSHLAPRARLELRAAIGALVAATHIAHMAHVFVVWPGRLLARGTAIQTLLAPRARLELSAAIGTRGGTTHVARILNGLTQFFVARPTHTLALDTAVPDLLAPRARLELRAAVAALVAAADIAGHNRLGHVISTQPCFL